MRTLLTLADRTAVLFLGVAAGVAIGYAFADEIGGGIGGTETAAPAIVVPPAAGVAPPPPATGAGQTAAVSAPVTAAIPPAVVAFGGGIPAAGCVLAGQPRLLRAVAGGPVRVGVFGDSYGDGIWSALYRQLPAKDGYEVSKYSQQSTGFTRYASLNLEDHVRAQLAAKPVDIAVISFGANDTQGVLSGRHAAKLLGPEWQEIVGKRVEGYVAALRAEGATVYWVGLPKMRKPQFDADIAGMNAFYAARMAALGVPWIETASMTVDGKGQFSPYLPDGPDGERTLIRANDGIHMSMTGYVRITRGLASGIRRCVSSARRIAGVPEPVAPAPRRPAGAPA